MRGIGEAERHERADRMLDVVQHARLRRSHAGAALGRPAAARGAGPRADHQPARAAARRAALGARRVPAAADAERAQAAAEGSRHHLRPRDPYPARGDRAGRPRRGHEPGQHRAGGLARGRSTPRRAAPMSPASWAGRTCCAAACATPRATPWCSTVRRAPRSGRPARPARRPGRGRPSRRAARPHPPRAGGRPIGALPENAVRGVVEAVEYQGTYVKVTLAGASGEEFIVNEPDGDFVQSPVEAGDPVVAAWEPASARLLDARSRRRRRRAALRGGGGLSCGRPAEAEEGPKGALDQRRVEAAGDDDEAGPRARRPARPADAPACGSCAARPGRRPADRCRRCSEGPSPAGSPIHGG